MTEHYFETAQVKLHYYRFGNGEQKMLCFHGFGMHGRQFISLEPSLGSKYTFYGFDLFFHEATLLKDQSIPTLKKGLSKAVLARLITDFCAHEGIGRFSVMGYSMGSHYATAVTEQLADRINEYIVVAPASINPGKLVRFFTLNKIGQLLLEQLLLSKNGMFNLLRTLNWLGVVSTADRDVLYREIATPQLRFVMYACFTYLRYLGTDEGKLVKAIEENHLKSFFIFGKRDKMYPPAIGKFFLPKLKQPTVIVLDEAHEMITPKFVSTLTRLLS